MKTSLSKNDCNYCPFYCEENIWHLVQEPALEAVARKVIFISNPRKQCLFFSQKAGDRGYVLWDYHVIMATPGLIWDFDTLLPFPCTARKYLNTTFNFPPDSPFKPIFKIVDPELYLQQFASDRAHMLDKEGNFIHPPPPWEPINSDTQSTLHHFIDMTTDTFSAMILDFGKMLRWTDTFEKQ